MHDLTFSPVPEIIRALAAAGICLFALLALNLRRLPLSRQEAKIIPASAPTRRHGGCYLGDGSPYVLRSALFPLRCNHCSLCPDQSRSPNQWRGLFLIHLHAGFRNQSRLECGRLLLRRGRAHSSTQCKIPQITTTTALVTSARWSDEISIRRWGDVWRLASCWSLSPSAATADMEFGAKAIWPNKRRTSSRAVIMKVQCWWLGSFCSAIQITSQPRRVMADTAELAGRNGGAYLARARRCLEPNVAWQTKSRWRPPRFGLASSISLATSSEPSRPSASGSAKYHQLAGAIAIADKNPALAETEFAAALQLEPNNRQLALNLATVRLALPDLVDQGKGARGVGEARGTVRSCAWNRCARLCPTHSPQFANFGGEMGGAIEGGKRRNLRRPATLSRSDPKDWRTVKPPCARLKRTQPNRPRTASALITWMNRHGMARPALDWALALPRNSRYPARSACRCRGL